MGKINVLDFQVANLIAAGEVVDRPASVIKELLENSLDSGATQITAEIKNGGISFMRVADNGCGMSREDVPVCIKRHATSKIKNADDLDGIMTLGFRGEALAAIAAVSKLRIITKPQEAAGDAPGTLLECENGEIVGIGDTGCRNGTTVIVENLFANVPARLKFLKKDSSEAAAVYGVVEKVALSRPDVSLKLISDGEVKFATAGDGVLMNAVYAVLGRDYAKKLFTVDTMTEGIIVKGYIGSPGNVRGSRSYQNFFLNGRYIKSGTMTAALEEAFTSYIQPEKFPCCILNVTIHPALVDVNVHPAKLEVKFSNERIVFNAVYCAVVNTLSQNVKRPELEIGKTILTADDFRIANAFVPLKDKAENTEDKNIYSGQIKISDVSHDTAEKKSAGIFQPQRIPTDRTLPEKEETAANSVKTEPVFLPKSENKVAVSGGNPPITPPPKNKEPELPMTFYRIIGTAFDTYIFIEREDGKVLVVDKHAAHERIIFEDMKRAMKNNTKYSQLLLLPHIIKLTGSEYAALLEYKTEISMCGLDFEAGEEPNTVLLLAVPTELDSSAAAEMLEVMAQRLCDGGADPLLTRDIVFEKALYQGACKAAVKAGIRDSVGHIRWLCDRLMRLDDITYCPHGRPVAIELTKHEIEKQFKRV